MFITKGKPHFSLTSSFYCCLVKEGWALKVALQFVMQGPLAYKPTPTPPSKSLCQAIYLLPGQTNSPHLHQHIDKHLLNFIFCESQTNNVSVALEPWGVEGWRFQELVILAFPVGGERVARFWGKGVNIQKYWMIWNGITLLLSLLLSLCKFFTLFWK